MGKASKKEMVKEDVRKDTCGVVLAVEDEATSLMILVGFLEDLGYEVLEAQNGHEALEILMREENKIDVVVLDKNMPEMDGLEVVEHMKDDPVARQIPVVMVTGATKPDEVREGIDAGVFYYLSKPYEPNVFKSVMTSAIREANRRSALKSELKRHQMSFGFMDNAEFTVRHYAEAEGLACFLANCFPNPDMTLQGLAHLLTNAVEHGNLEIDFATKSKLLKNHTWHEEIEKREDMAKYADRVVKVRLERDENEVRVRIEDQGNGFDWQKYLEIDPERALDTHGRGIAQANKISFDRLIYNEKGNVVTAVSEMNTGIKW